MEQVSTVDMSTQDLLDMFGDLDVGKHPCVYGWRESFIPVLPTTLTHTNYREIFIKSPRGVGIWTFQYAAGFRGPGILIKRSTTLWTTTLSTTIWTTKLTYLGQAWYVNLITYNTLYWIIQ